MNLELITTGTELLLGDVTNTHLAWIGRKLADMGFPLHRHVTVPDGSAIRSELQSAIDRNNLIICTGGLGPTSDDITRETLADILRKKLIQDASQLQRLKEFFADRGKSLSETNLRQAMVPEGAVLLPNPNGTAPGLYFPEEGIRKPIFLLPGPPRELHPMWESSVEPELGRILGVTPAPTRRLRVTGMGESDIAEMIQAPLDTIVGLDYGYRLGNGDVEIRLQGTEAATDAALAICRSRLGSAIFTERNEDLETALVRLLTQKELTVALAESCTGGLIASRLTSVPGSSRVFGYGWVTYSNQAKQRELGVTTDTLTRHGAVSELTAQEMAQGALTASGADFALSVTGIAGPDGGSEDKPVGTVWMGLARHGEGPEATLLFYPYGRECFQRFVSQAALDRLRRAVL